MLQRATKHSAGYDLRSVEPDFYIQPNQTKLIRTDIRLDLDETQCGLICSRSGLAFKHNIIVLNSPAVIDADYKDEVKIILHNLGDKPFKVSYNMRIAQLVIINYQKLKGDDADYGEIRQGGFGSTGVD